MRFILALLWSSFSLPVSAKTFDYAGSFKAHDRGIHDMAIAVDHRSNTSLLATAGGESSVKIWDVNSTKLLQAIQAIGPSRIFDLAFIKDAATIAVAPHAAKPVIFDIQSGRVLHTITDHLENVPRLLSADHRLFTAGSDDRINIWDTGNWELQGSLSMKSPVAMTLLPGDASKLITASLDGLQLWDIESNSLIRTYETKEEGGGYNVSLAMHPTHSLFATGDMPALGKGVRLWDLNTGKVIETLKGIKGFIWQLSYSPDGSLLAATAHQGQTVVWDTKSNKVIFDSETAKIAPTLSSVFSNDGHSLFVGDVDGNVHRYTFR